MGWATKNPRYPTEITRLYRSLGFYRPCVSGAQGRRWMRATRPKKRGAQRAEGEFFVTVKGPQDMPWWHHGDDNDITWYNHNLYYFHKLYHYGIIMVIWYHHHSMLYQMTIWFVSVWLNQWRWKKPGLGGTTRILQHPPVITIFLGGMFTISSQTGGFWYRFAHSHCDSWWFNGDLMVI